MKETERIIKLFDDLYQGNPWLDVNIKDSLKNITAEQAYQRIADGRNSIWEIVNHVTQWRMNVLRRIKGEVLKSPDHNYILPIEDPTEVAWKASIEELVLSQQEWIDYLREMEEEDLDKIYPRNKMTYYEHIQGILQHDAYHLGQVVLLIKLQTQK